MHIATSQNNIAMTISKIVWKMHWAGIVLVLFLATTSACRSVSVMPGGAPTVTEAAPARNIPVIPLGSARAGTPVIHTAALMRIDSLLLEGIEQQAFPGAVVAVGRDTQLVKMDGYGAYTYRSRRRMRPNSLFDLASLTKVIATTTATMLLHEQGRLDIDAPVARYLPGFDRPDKRLITVRHLLTHTSGLAAFKEFYSDGLRTREAVIDAIMASELINPVGTTYVYSDFGMIALALAIENITGMDFAAWCEINIFLPLGMESTGFRGTGEPDSLIVPTEQDDYFRNRLLQGEVHDENAWLLGGTAGHAGLFSTARDLSRFVTMMVRGGRYQNRQFLRPETIRLFTTTVDTSLSTRALGWDTRNLDRPSSSGKYFGPRSYGHTGFTGTSIWIDPDAQLFVILLTNRVYPTRENYAYTGIRPLVADASYEALFGVPETIFCGTCEE